MLFSSRKRILDHSSLDVVKRLYYIFLNLPLVSLEVTQVKQLIIFKLKVFVYICLDKMPGPANNSLYNYIKLSFKEGLDSNFVTQLSDTIIKRVWETPIAGLIVINAHDNRGNSKLLPQIKPRTGIIGIERSLQEKQKETDQNISLAFQDLTKLMDMAKDMVAISKTISAKIRVIFNDCFVRLNSLRFIMQDHCRRDKVT